MPTKYGSTHKRERARLAPTVDAGEAHCSEIVCLEEEDGRTRWIPPGTPWDLAHDGPDTYRGPAHERCNRSEGAIRGNQQRTPRRWAL